MINRFLWPLVTVSVNVNVKGDLDVTVNVNVTGDLDVTVNVKDGARLMF